jgi:uncharacterized protein YjdB
MTRATYTLAAAAFVVIGAACSGPSQEDPPITVQVGPADTTMVLGDTLSMRVALVTISGTQASGFVAWTSSDPTVVAISTKGTASALKVGSVTLTATETNQNKSASSHITVVDTTSAS